MVCKCVPKKCRHPGHSLADDTVEIFDDYSNLYVGTECETNFHGQRVESQGKKAENFTHIIDLDSYEFHKIIVYDFLGRILQSIAFRSLILILVLVNAILIGLQTKPEYDSQYGTIFTIVDHVILSIFIFEIMLKWAHDFRMFWVVKWNILDFFIVCLICASSITPNLANSKALMLVRVVRAFRSLRSVSSLSSLAIVTHTIFKSMGDMTSILFVLLIFMVVLAVMGVTLFEVDELNGTINSPFNSPFQAWYLLFVCITQDGWVTYMEAWRKLPPRYFGLLMIYVVIAIAIGAFIFSNLIIAVVVANLEMGVAEIRAEKLANMNPLTYFDNQQEQIIEVQPTFAVFTDNNTPLRSQRPMKLPSLKKVNPRRLQGYIQAVVALEQNILEYSLIETDLEKIMGVIVSIAKQLEPYNPYPFSEELQKRWGQIKDAQHIGSIPIPVDVLDRTTLLDDLKKTHKSHRKL